MVASWAYTKHLEYSKDALELQPNPLANAKEAQQQPSQVPRIVMTYQSLPTTVILRETASLWEYLAMGLKALFRKALSCCYHYFHPYPPKPTQENK